MTKTYKSEVMASIHEMMEELASVGSIDEKTMKEFDDLCLTPVHPLTAKETRSIGEKENEV